MQRSEYRWFVVLALIVVILNLAAIGLLIFSPLGGKP